MKRDIAVSIPGAPKLSMLALIWKDTVKAMRRLQAEPSSDALNRDATPSSEEEKTTCSSIRIASTRGYLSGSDSPNSGTSFDLPAFPVHDGLEVFASRTLDVFSLGSLMLQSTVLKLCVPNEATGTISRCLTRLLDEEGGNAFEFWPPAIPRAASDAMTYEVKVNPNFRTPLVFWLRASKVDNAQPYFALSYAWDLPNSVHPIQRNENALSFRDKLCDLSFGHFNAVPVAMGYKIEVNPNFRTPPNLLTSTVSRSWRHKEKTIALHEAPGYIPSLLMDFQSRHIPSVLLDFRSRHIPRSLRHGIG